MSRSVQSHAAIMIMLVGCSNALSTPQELRDRATREWQREMTVIDDSIRLWSNGAGTAPYTPQDITNAIDFFEHVTGIHSGAMSFLGPIPDQQLVGVRDQWKKWYETHRARLTFDPSSERVIVADGDSSERLRR
jgi:hypothetical protein